MKIFPHKKSKKIKPKLGQRITIHYNDITIRFFLRRITETFYQCYSPEHDFSDGWMKEEYEYLHRQMYKPYKIKKQFNLKGEPFKKFMLAEYDPTELISF